MQLVINGHLEVNLPNLLIHAAGFSLFPFYTRHGMKLISLFWFAMISFILPLFTAFAELMDNALDEVFFLWVTFVL
jgi:hypothetical protein